jgi:hypothetical protein
MQIAWNYDGTLAVSVNLNDRGVTIHRFNG